MSDELPPPALSSPIGDDEAEFVMPADIGNAVPEGDGIITIMGGIPEADLNEIYKNRLQELGQAAFTVNVRTTGTYDNLLWFALNNMSGEAGREQDAIALVPSEHREDFSYRLVKDGKTVLGPSILSPIGGLSQNATGESGIVQMMASRRGKLRRIPLYNSGFCIDIRSPTPDELSTLIRDCKIETNEYGRSFGAHFYLYFDLVLKNHFIEMIMKITLNSTLKDYQSPGVLLKSIKLCDYNTILASVAALMYPDGYTDFKHACTRPHDTTHHHGCDHVETLKIDITKMVHTNFASLNKEAITHLVKARNPAVPVTKDEVVIYQKALGYDGKQIRFADCRVTLTTPSLLDYLEAGEQFNKDLLNDIQADNTKGIYEALAFREMRAYLPWVSQIETMNDDGEPKIGSSDKTVIAFLLDDLMSTKGYNQHLLTPIIEYINTVQLTHICYPTFECPSCHHQPQTKSGFFTLDPQNMFFTLAFQTLIRSSSTL